MDTFALPTERKGTVSVTSLLSEWGRRFLSKKKKKNCQQDFYKVGAKKEESKEETGTQKKKKIKEHVCKLTLTAQQGACVDRGRKMIWFTDIGKGWKESKQRGTRDKTNSIIFSIKRKTLAFPPQKTPPA